MVLKAKGPFGNPKCILLSQLNPVKSNKIQARQLYYRGHGQSLLDFIGFYWILLHRRSATTIG